MNTQEPLDLFESRLLLALRAEVGRAATPERPARSRPVWARSGALAGAAATVVLAGAIALQAGGDPTPAPGAELAAFTVSTEKDGDVEVVLHRLEDAAGLQRALAAKGVRAVVRYDGDLLSESVTTDPPPTDPGAATPEHAVPLSKAEADAATRCQVEVLDRPDGAVFRVPAPLVGADRELEIITSGSLDSSYLITVGWRGGGC